MMCLFMRALAQFCRKDSGTATVETAILLPVFALVLAGGVEMGLMNIRHAMLERGLDMTARVVRLNTGFVPDYQTLLASICQKASIIRDCEANMRLEMKVVAPRAYTDIPGSVDCTNAVEEARPLRNFEAGVENKLMLLRACLKFKPLFPTTALGAVLPADSQGYVPLVATSAFVQEPR